MRLRKLICTICKFTCNQLNTSVILETFLMALINEEKFLKNTLVISNFGICPLGWFITLTNSLNKINTLRNFALKFLSQWCVLYARTRSKQPSILITVKENLEFSLRLYQIMVLFSYSKQNQKKKVKRNW